MNGRHIWLAVILALFVMTSCFVCAEDQQLLLKKSQLLVQKGIRAEDLGDFEDAAALYEDALAAYPRNIMPVLMLGKLLARIGMYAKAEERLRAIPLQQLPPAGQAEVYLLFGKIALARGSVEEAGSAYKKALDATPENVVALTRKTICEILLGFSVSEKQLEHFFSYDTFQGLPKKEQALAFLLDIHFGRLLRAFNTCMLLDEDHHGEGGGNLLTALWFFVLSLPLGLSGIIAALYYMLLFSLLVFVATRLSAPVTVWYNVLFVVVGAFFMLSAHSLCFKDMMIAAMLDDFSSYDIVWIIPKMLVAGHFVALALFFVFPAFLRLPEEQRPLRYELYGIWFFCWFFMIFVLVFQSRLALGTRVAVMAGSALMAMFAMVFMPLGRFVIFNIASAAGFAEVASVSRTDVQKAGSISYTDAKIIESNAWKLLEKDSYEEVVLTARKVFTTLDRKNFSSLWKAMILAQICKEDFFEAQRNITEFVENFKGTPLAESGQLLEAYMRCRKGDFAAAVLIIRGLSDRGVKAFSNDETGLSLFILGCCGVSFKEYVQAHIDLGKALTFARLPFLRAEILVELTELDLLMKAKEALSKWKARSDEVRGGLKTRSLVQIVRSMVLLFEGQKDKALELAEESCKLKSGNSRAFYWYGHLLCLEGRVTDAELLLQNMNSDSYDATRLMSETTGSASLE